MTRRRLLRRVITIGALTLATVLVASIVVLLLAPAGNATEGVVDRVVDGDTIVVEIDGEPVTVRLLNIDTPETKDPDSPVECLGPESAAFVEDLAPPGTRVSLEYDVERHDRYGRTLATLRLPNGDSLAERIASEGLGAPLVVGKNAAALAEVEAGRAEAEAAGRGFFDPENDCTLPHQVAAAKEHLTQARAMPQATTSAASASSITAYAAAVAALNRVHALVSAPSRTLRTLVYAPARLSVIRAAIATDLAAARSELAAREQSKARLLREEKAAAERRAAEAAERARQAAEAAERARRQAEAAERARREAAAAEAERKRRQESGGSSGSGSGGSGSGGGSYPGYTGPRCYDPGGVTWHPC